MTLQSPPSYETADVETPSYATAFLAALHFLTILPVSPRRAFSEQSFSRAVAFFPLIGLVVGTILCLLDRLLAQLLPTPVACAMVITAWIVLTGALHLDGFLDSCDALFTASTPEQRREILRDERVGAFAVAGGISLMLLKFTAITSLPVRGIALLAAPTVARGVMACALFVYPTARATGLGCAMKRHARWRDVLLAVATTVVLLAFVPAWPVIAMLAVLTGWLVAAFSNRRLEGLTGDSYGMVVETTEAAVLVALCVT